MGALDLARAGIGAVNVMPGAPPIDEASNGARDQECHGQAAEEGDQEEWVAEKHHG